MTGQDTGAKTSGANSIADGATEEFVFTFTYTGATSADFSVVLEEVGDVPVGYTIYEE